MMEIHSREWFLQQVAIAKKDVAQWPSWMKEGKTVATASFPRVGVDQKNSQAESAKDPQKKKRS